MGYWFALLNQRERCSVYILYIPVGKFSVGKFSVCQNPSQAVGSKCKDREVIFEMLS